MKIEAVTLDGTAVRLEPMAERHVPQLARAASHDDLWRYMPFHLGSEESVAGWLSVADQWLASGEGIVFATILRETGEVVGSTAFMAASPPNRRVEIGATWVTPSSQRTVANTEAKYLMMQHAFETWNCMRVEFKTDALNEKSRNALLRIGATEEGTHRSHMVMPDGRIRDSVYFSVVDAEWPEVRSRLEGMLAG
jgi:RimJ/RimL family protein N-acetyltransferase